jgi:SAM-dependent methyltransferase
VQDRLGVRLWLRNIYDTNCLANDGASHRFGHRARNGCGNLPQGRVAGLSNVVGVVRDFVADGCGLPDQHAGRAMLFNILHVDNPLGLLREAYRVLAPGGEVAIIHWRNDIPTPRGPSLPIRPSAEQCRSWGEQVGFEFIRNELLCCCSWHWGIVMALPL